MPDAVEVRDLTVQFPAVRALDGVSLVAAPYRASGQVLGVLGVIGPTRMAYQTVIPVVQAAADALGAALNPEPPPP